MKPHIDKNEPKGYERMW